MGNEVDPSLYRSYISAMNEGSPDAIAELFAPDGVYVEPFTTGQPNEVVGPDAVRQYFEMSMKMRPSDMTVTLDEVQVEKGIVTSRWTCSSKEWDRPMQGNDEMHVRDGTIARLEVHLEFGTPSKRRPDGPSGAGPRAPFWHDPPCLAISAESAQR
ncbi:MAG: nuclear transport factor 2 family protein [Actinomycetota bacterium]|nr:nuclear transport factor 2 family protein [Actinomycetota bacterium]